MVDVNSFTCSLIAFPTPLPPKKILTNTNINNLCGSARFPPAMYFYLTLVTIGKHFYRHQCRFSEHLACSLPDRESGAGDGSLGPPCHPVTLPPPCNMSIVQTPLLWNTYPATSSAIYIQPPLILIGAIHLRFTFLWLYSIAASPLVDE